MNTNTYIYIFLVVYVDVIDFLDYCLGSGSTNWKAKNEERYCRKETRTNYSEADKTR